MSSITDFPRKQAEISPEACTAIEAQQSRVGRLHALIQCVMLAVESHANEVDDPVAALAALADLAESIHMDLDTGTLVKQAAQIREDQAPEAQGEDAS